jgi:hypothetical protein
MKATREVLALALLAIIASASGGSIKKWVDDQGRVHFGDAPPPAAGSVIVAPQPAYSSSQPAGRHAASTGGLRPGEQRMLERIEKEEREHVEAMDRSVRESAQRKARDARTRKLSQAKCDYYRALVRESDQRLRQPYSNPQRRLHDETKRALYARQAALYCP